MLTTTRRDKRNRRQAQFQLECLDDRLVLSATGGMGPTMAHLTAVEHRLETRLATLEARNGDNVTPAMARIQTRLAGIQARLSSPVTAATPTPKDPHGLLPVSVVTGPNGQIVAATNGAVSTSVPTSSGSAGSAGATTDATSVSPKDPHGLLPVSVVTGPNGQIVASTDGAVPTSSNSADATTDATTVSPKDPHGLLPVSVVTGPNGQIVASTN